MSAIVFFPLISLYNSTLPPVGKPSRFAFSGERITLEPRLPAGSAKIFKISGIILAVYPLKCKISNFSESQHLVMIPLLFVSLNPLKKFDLRVRQISEIKWEKKCANKA
ncbi:MAG: hypothetical protein RBG13Loki_2024 [Promethearchaeota archaeon CR_4]|nr:MAG: hypothetical protein RBG13Loki_2024 [Candidatus Lokiarchaeota archaeon CR_4]